MEAGVDRVSDVGGAVDGDEDTGDVDAATGAAVATGAAAGVATAAGVAEASQGRQSASEPRPQHDIRPSVCLSPEWSKTVVALVQAV